MGSRVVDQLVEEILAPSKITQIQSFPKRGGCNVVHAFLHPVGMGGLGDLPISPGLIPTCKPHKAQQFKTCPHPIQGLGPCHH